MYSAGRTRNHPTCYIIEVFPWHLNNLRTPSLPSLINPVTIRKCVAIPHPFLIAIYKNGIYSTSYPFPNCKRP
jgi:hypothetical protein